MKNNRLFWGAPLLALLALVSYFVANATRPRPRLHLEVISTSSNQWLQISITNTLRSSISIDATPDLNFGAYVLWNYESETVSANSGGRPSYFLMIRPGDSAERRLLMPNNVKHVDASVEYTTETWIDKVYLELRGRGFSNCANIVAQFHKLWPSAGVISERIDPFVTTPTGIK